MVNNYDMGITISSVPVLSLTAALRWGDGVTYYSMGFNPTEVNKIQTSTDKNFIFNKITTSASLFENTTKTTTLVTNRSGLPNGNFFIAARNLDGTAQQSPQRNCAFSSIGDGLTDAEVTAFYNAVQAYQTTLGRQVNIPKVSDVDAQAFLNAANITSFQQASAVNKLVVDLKAAGVWTKMKAIYPFVGGSATSHKFNLKDPRDLDDAFRLVFSGGWTHSSTGALPNGSNAYADTKLIPLSHLLEANHHYTYYSRSNDTPLNEVEIGTANTWGYYSAHMRVRLNGYYGVTNKFTIALHSSNTYVDTSYTNTDSRGFYQGQITSTSSRKLYKNGVNVANVTQNSPVDRSPWKVYIGALSEENIAKFFSRKETAFASIGDGMTDTEASAFYTAVQTYQTSLGRAVDTPVYNNGLVLNLDAGNANSYPGTGTTWFDLASSTNGSLVNSPTFNSNQFTFNGTNQFVNFGNINNIGTDSVTLVAWIKTIANQDYAGIIGKAFYGDKLGRFSLHTRSGGKLGIITQNLQGGALQITEVTSTQNINTGNWVFVVGVIDRSYGNKLYINGFLDGVSTRDTSGVNWSTTDNFTIGYYNGNGSGYFNGSISNVFMYRRVLTDNEIINLYNSTRGRFGL
jgi:hypothetical protein